ncbi:hypothetical protein L0156_09140 [bacterium]|nr:hypothetical protein [bacterium]
MRFWGKSKFFFFSLFLSAAFFVFTEENRVLVLQNVVVIDATGAPPKKGMTVVINGDRIDSIGKNGATQIPDGASIGGLQR